MVVQAERTLALYVKSRPVNCARKAKARAANPRCRQPSACCGRAACASLRQYPGDRIRRLLFVAVRSLAWIFCVIRGLTATATKTAVRPASITVATICSGARGAARAMPEVFNDPDDACQSNVGRSVDPALGATYFSAGRYFKWRVEAAGPVPFTLRMEIASPPGHVYYLDTLARRSDGTEVRRSGPAAGPEDNVARTIRFPDGDVLTIFDYIRAKTTWALTPQDRSFFAQRLRERWGVFSRCIVNAGQARSLVTTAYSVALRRLCGGTTRG